ncbi:TIR domain-containing protein [Azovibrio restrictus]|uniref:TIR domain-containing protein n=1 Tax=Azovibrio restrictus TaxID=146938 RepID=UPI0004173E96|nr:TIR domain-containing protein [Azovibrio restrictus]
MPLHEKTDEIRRLISSFETESGKFYPLKLSLLFVTQDGTSFNRPFMKPNHAIMLWQYYGTLGGDGALLKFQNDLVSSDLKWGIRGAALSCYGLLEGEGLDLFLRMAQRAGSLFDEDEATLLQIRATSEIIENEKKRLDLAKPTVTSNNNPLAVWLNYLIFHLSMTNPGRERSQQIEPDPFSLSLIALERLYVERRITKSDRSTMSADNLNFKVAVSFPGDRRSFVSTVVDKLRPALPADSIFYDYDYQAQLSRPNLDIFLQDIYRNRSDLIVIFLCESYTEKQWCGLEWRAIRDLIKSKRDDQLMFVRFDDAPVEGLFSLDGYIDARVHTPEKVADFILERVRLNETSGVT